VRSSPGVEVPFLLRWQLQGHGVEGVGVGRLVRAGATRGLNSRGGEGAHTFCVPTVRACVQMCRGLMMWTGGEGRKGRTGGSTLTAISLVPIY